MALPLPAPDRAATVARLRAHLQQVAPVRAAPVVDRLPTGHAGLDARVGGLPRAGVTVVEGAPGSGRLGVVLPALGALTRAGRAVAVVDVPGWLHPPGLDGVCLDSLLLVRPGEPRALWAAEQLARCEGLALVLVLDPPPFRALGRRLVHAAEEGRTSVVLLSEAPQADLPAALHLRCLAAGRVEILRARGARPGTVALGCPAGPIRATLSR